MCGWRNTSDLQPLLSGLRRQPVLAVLRPADPSQARLQLQQLQQAGLLHVELAVSLRPQWPELVQQLQAEFPQLRLGAASVRCAAGLQAALRAGLGYAVSPILDRELLAQAQASGLPLVPGVFSPSEVASAVAWGAEAVKLYPAAALGPDYWGSLRGPLGPLPFCMAAGGLSPDDGAVWLQSGVDAVALGGCLFEDTAGGSALRPGLLTLLQWLRFRADP